MAQQVPFDDTCFALEDETKNREVCAIVRVKKKTDVHRANLEDDFQTIRSMLEQKLSAEFGLSLRRSMSQALLKYFCLLSEDYSSAPLRQPQL